MSALYVKRDGPPALSGQQCLLCERISFPPNPYGCESCGAPVQELEAKLLNGRGRVMAFVTVNRAIRPNIEVPYRVASIALDEGPVIRALMNASADAVLQVGDTVEAELVAVANPEQEQAQPVRFRRLERP